MTYQAILHGKVSSEALSASLEDVLTSVVFGALTYGPPALARDWLASVVGVAAGFPNLTVEFWPQHHLPDGSAREPDVFVTDSSAGVAVIVEAKLGADPSARQLRDEAIAARSTHPATRTLHLLTVSDRALKPPSFRAIQSQTPRPYETMRHASWARLYVFLEDWVSRHECDAGHRRMIDDALAVLRRYGRDPFRGLTGEEVRAMARDVGWMFALPRELAKLHAELTKTVDGLKPPLVALDTGVYTDVVGGQSFTRPDGWLPRHFTLRYGAPDGTAGDPYYFVRALLTRQEVWVGYALRHRDGERLLADATGTTRLVAEGTHLTVAGVRSKGQPFEVLVDPQELSAAALVDLVAMRHVPRVNIVRVFPMRIMARTGGDRTLGRELVRVIRLCRSVPSLEAP